MSTLPRDTSLDSTISLLSEGYDFIGNRCRRFGTDLFRTRLMLTPVVCMSGAEAAEQFYQPGRFTRRGAMPTTTFTQLQDFGSVATLDGDAHRWRKAMFLGFLRPEALGDLPEVTAAHWRKAVREWSRRDRIVLFDAAHLPLCAAICEWVGLALSPEEVTRRAGELKATIEGAGSAGWRMLHGQRMRARLERWARGVIRGIRAGSLAVPAGRPAAAIASHRDPAGHLLDDTSAAVELLNVLRPTVANARFFTYAALALHQHPSWRERLEQDDTGLEAFVQEVRRFYPFFPMIGGRVLQPFAWRGHDFRAGDWVLLDLYGTNRDPARWEAPDAFNPDRFRGREPGPYEFIPQGGGAHAETHRCPGEWVTVEQLKIITRLLVREMRYAVPQQDLHIDLGRMPALPRSGMVLHDVALREAATMG